MQVSDIVEDFEGVGKKGRPIFRKGVFRKSVSSIKEAMAPEDIERVENCINATIRRHHIFNVQNEDDYLLSLADEYYRRRDYLSAGLIHARAVEMYPDCEDFCYEYIQSLEHSKLHQVVIDLCVEWIKACSESGMTDFVLWMLSGAVRKQARLEKAQAKKVQATDTQLITTGG